MSEQQTLTIRQALKLARQHHTASRLPQAEGIYRKILAKHPDHPTALHFLGVIAHQVGKNSIASDLITKALASDPRYAEAHCNLGLVFHQLHKLDEAIASYRKALHLKPDFTEAHNNLGNALQDLGKLNKAVENYRNALALDDKHANSYVNLGVALSKMNLWEEALNNFRKVLDLEPGYPLLHSHLGFAFNAIGRRDEALHHFYKNMKLNSQKRLNDQTHMLTEPISRPRLEHDLEQFQYLASLNSQKSERFNKLADTYAKLLAEIDWERGDNVSVILTKEQRSRIHETYSIPIHLGTGNDGPDPTLNEELDTTAITHEYSKGSTNLVVADNFLTPKALSTLQKFLLESTIWFDVKQNGYIGALLQNGLACPLLLQIADDLPQTFPLIFEDHKLTRLWAYKYDSKLRGINVHADDAAVNVNFWVTPDSANLQPERGGLVVYDTESPEDWAYDLNYTGNATSHIKKYLKEQSSNKIVIPYAENRAVIFRSNLFHETDMAEFKPGYENRRINITLLFGRRTSKYFAANRPDANRGKAKSGNKKNTMKQ